MVKSIFITCALASCLALVTSCGSRSGGGSLYDPGYGPFDKEGNYLEKEADKPARQKRRAGFSGKSKSIAKTELVKEKKPEPPKKETVTKSSKPSSSSSSSSKKPAKTTSVKKPTAKPKPKPVAKPKPAPKPKAKPTPKPKPKAKPAPKPKPKPKIVAKPQSTFHRIVKGDTLYSISRKYGTSTSAIQKANGMQSTTILLGTTLRIPR